MKAPVRRRPRQSRPGALPIDRILEGDCRDLLARLPEKSIDLVFADPPYFLQLSHELWRPNETRVQGVDDAWDRFADFAEYDSFTEAWLGGVRRVLKDDGALWVIGTYHNIYRVGRILQDLGFWILNDVVWVKTNPMPNFRGVRFTNAHEILIWAACSKKARYTFNYHAMKALNDGLQMRSDWRLPICSGPERLRSNGAKAHATQKPEALLRRVLQASTRPGDVVLDPFFGTGTTGVAAKRLGRHWIGIEKQPSYVKLARRRIAAVRPDPEALRLAQDPKPPAERVPFPRLVQEAMVRPGQRLYFRGLRSVSARIRADGRVAYDSKVGSIHQIARALAGAPCNGWDHWYFEDPGGSLRPIDELRKTFRRKRKQA
jgi:modification methylase